MTAPTIAPGPQTQSQPAPPQGGGADGQKAAPLPAWPYPVGAFATEVANDYDNTVTATTSTVAMPDVKLDPDGWGRDAWFDFTLTGVNTTSTTVTANEDWPFNSINTVLFKDTGTQQSFGPFNGYDWKCINKFGGYDANGDPELDPDYSITTGTATTAGSARFFLKLPMELSTHDGLGSIQNQSDNSIYKVSITVETTANQFTTAPATSQTVRLRVTQDSYTEPVAALALGGRPVASAPPSPGTRQFWLLDDDTGIPASGAHTTKITNGIGYAYRTIIFKLQRAGVVGTSSTTGRAGGESDYPDPTEVWLAGTRIKRLYNNTWRTKIARQYQFLSTTTVTSGVAPDTAGGPSAGIRVLLWNRDIGMDPGNEARRTYLRTQDGNVFKIIGTYGHAGTLWFLTNYVIPKGGPSSFANIVA